MLKVKFFAWKTWCFWHFAFYNRNNCYNLDFSGLVLCKSLHNSSTFFHNSYSFPQFLHNKPVISTIILYFFPHKCWLWKLWTLFLAQTIHPFPCNDLPNVFNQAKQAPSSGQSGGEALYLLQQLKHSSRTIGVPSKLHAPPLQQLP